MIDGIKRNSTIYVGYFIVRKTDSRLNNDEGIVVCMPGARIEHVTEIVQRIMGLGNGVTILVHIGTNNLLKKTLHWRIIDKNKANQTLWYMICITKT